MNHKINDLVNYFSNKWQLSNLRPVSRSIFTKNYVVLAYSSQYSTDVVLKVLIANTHEAEALLFFDGNACVKLLDYDLEKKVLLLECIKPGIDLKTLFPEDDSRAIEITAEIIRKLHEKNLISQLDEKEFKTVNQWLDLLNRFQSKKISKHLLEKAQQLSEKLLNSKQKLYLLHGDLHHENILKNGDEWVAIDPKGVIGPLEYEVGRFIMNPIPDLLLQQDGKEIIKNRINKFNEIFGFEKRRLIDWTFVQSVLSACWSEEDDNKEFANSFIKFAETIENL